MLRLGDWLQIGNRTGTIAAWGIERGYSIKGKTHPVQKSSRKAAYASGCPHVLIDFWKNDAEWWPLDACVSIPPPLARSMHDFVAPPAPEPASSAAEAIPDDLPVAKAFTILCDELGVDDDMRDWWGLIGALRAEMAESATESSGLRARLATVTAERDAAQATVEDLYTQRAAIGLAQLVAERERDAMRAALTEVVSMSDLQKDHSFGNVAYRLVNMRNIAERALSALASPDAEAAE